MSLQDVEIKVRRSTTAMFPKESIRVCIEEKVSVFLAGQVSSLIKEIKPAAQVLEEMVAEAVDILTRRLPGSVVVK
jgi:hypothetical protein